MLVEVVGRRRIALDDQRQLELDRDRFEGPLQDDEIAACRREGVPIAFDPMQTGWVLAETPIWAAAMPAAVNGRALAVAFRRWTVTDLPLFVSLLDDPDVWRYLPEEYPNPLTVDLARDLITVSNGSDHHEVWAVEYDGVVVGQIRLTFDKAHGDMAEISYWLGKRYWGRGLASRMVAQYTHESFLRHPHLKAIVACVHARNVASAHVVRKCGYRADGPAPNDPENWTLFRSTR